MKDFARRMLAAVADSRLGGLFGCARRPAPVDRPALPEGAPPDAPTPPAEHPVPADPYHARWARLEEMLRDLDAALGPEPSAPTRRLLFFSTGAHWTDLSLAAAVVLAGRGCHVDFVWVPYPEFEDKPLSADERARLAASAPAVRHPRLRVLNALQLPPAAVTPAIRAEAERAAYVDAQYVVRREEIDIAPGTPGRAAYDFRLGRILTVMAGLATLLERHRYAAAVMANGAVLEFGAAYRLARLAGLPCTTLEYHDRRYCLHVLHGATVPDLDTTAAWRADEPHVYSPAREHRVRAILSGRASGDWAEYIWRCQTAPPAPAEELLDRLGLDAGKPLVLLCANIAHDSVVLGQGRAFDTMAGWVRAAIDLFAGRPDWQLVVRAHPGEPLMDPVESLESIVRAHCPNGPPPNVRLVLPGDPINTYVLMKVARLGLVYNSTAGLEMAAGGLPVVVAGRAHYSDKGFTRDADTPTQFAAAVTELASGPHRTPPRVAELARCYIDLYYNALPFPFPWSWSAGLTDDYQTWPVRRVLSGEGNEQFGRTFDALAGVPVSIAERLRAVA
jgi:hypothetical protein